MRLVRLVHICGSRARQNYFGSLGRVGGGAGKARESSGRYSRSSSYLRPFAYSRHWRTVPCRHTISV